VNNRDGQCGTCIFAREFADEDGVHCTSPAQAKMLDEQCNPDDPNESWYNQYQKEIESYGYMSLWRLEVLAEEGYRCPNWQGK